MTRSPAPWTSSCRPTPSTLRRGIIAPRAGARGAGKARWGRYSRPSLLERDPDAFVGLPLRFGLDDPHLTDLTRGGDVRAAVGLAVEADDVDDAQGVDRARDQVRLEPDERRVAV